MSSQRDPFQHRPPDAKTQVMKEILDEINSVLKRPEKPEKSFICGQDLRSIWATSSARIVTLLQPDQLSPDQIHVIQLRMIIILSTLVSIDAMDCLANFRSRFFDPNSGAPLLTDDDMPFTMEQLTFLDGGSALSQLFYQHQFQFTPIIIELTKNQRVQLIENRMARLPFIYSEQDIGEGSYGKVNRVRIPPGYIKGESGWVRDRVYEVAVKKIKVPEAFNEEVANLQILKESLTVHNRIMLHLATIKHGLKHYILLPYAEYGDLELFLHCGRGPTGEIKYDFKKRFNNVHSSDMTLPLLRQCWYLTDALKWLHGGITVEKSSSTVLCAHMDLKPANILIQYDPESMTGTWMISDFGISVLKEEAPQQGAGIVSIYDYYSQLTMNSQPKRQEGTYQAPEVKLTEDASKQKSNLTPDQKGIGRRSDIWSYGCIFSEVLAFALGGDELVCEYQTARKGQDGKDYFYIEKEDRGHLNAPGTGPKQYQVHPKVLQWLDSVCGTPLNSQGWVDCYVETIKHILIVDTQKRPDATKLQVLVEHVKSHVAASQDGSPVPCGLLRAKDGGLLPPHDGEEPEDTGPGYSIFSETSNASSSGSGSTSTTMNVKPPNAHGIMVDGVIRRTPSKAISRELPRPGSSPLRATAVAVTHSDSGIHVAYLAKSSVYIYKLDVNEQSASLEREVLLPQPHGWQGIAIAGNFLAAWGFYSRERQLHILDVRESQRQTSLPRLYDVKMLVRVAVSKSGAAALISSQQILVVKIEDQTWSPPLVPQPGQNFTDAAFNDTGDLLYAWAYGKNDSIYVWRCKDCAVNAKPESETHYMTEKIGKPYLTRVVPYNAYQGCIIAAQEKRFFAALLGSATTSLRESSTSTAEAASQPLQHNAKIVDVKAACVFCDHSLITVEKRWHGSVLKEYRVEYNGKNAELGTGVEICKLDTGREESARLVVGEWGDNVMAVVCNLNAVVEFVKIVPV